MAKKKRRKRLPKKKKFPKIQCDPPPPRESKPFKPSIWKPKIDKLPPNIQPVPRMLGGRIYECATCGLAETSILKDEAELLDFIAWHKKQKPECFTKR